MSNEGAVDSVTSCLLQIRSERAFEWLIGLQCASARPIRRRSRTVVTRFGFGVRFLFFHCHRRTFRGELMFGLYRYTAVFYRICRTLSKHRGDFAR